jgi:hypothetical protein
MLMPLAVPDPNLLSPDCLVQAVYSGENRWFSAADFGAFDPLSPSAARFR